MQQNETDLLGVAGATIKNVENRPRGRPPLPPGQRRRRTGLPLSDEERVILRDRAQSVGMPLATYIRSAALKHPITHIPKVNRQAWERLAPLAANLNQIAHALNRGAKVSDADGLNRLISDTAEAVQELRREMRGARK